MINDGGNKYNNYSDLISMQYMHKFKYNIESHKYVQLVCQWTIKKVKRSI